VLTGSGTALADNPRLDVRLVATEVQPLRVLIDSQLHVPASSNLFDPPGSPLVYCARASSAVDALRLRGVEVIERAAADGHVDLHAVLADLAQRGINELHVEGGPRLNAALLAADLVDEFLLYLAPKLIGPGLSIAALPELTALDDAPTLRFISAAPCGNDLRIIARPRDRERTLD
jgi:diaminohydroxyphosphoribosylaminopyrimidine deaminase/5-amino-6-(5-phosphoribosylamino)uracil reductase